MFWFLQASLTNLRKAFGFRAQQLNSLVQRCLLMSELLSTTISRTILSLTVLTSKPECLNLQWVWMPTDNTGSRHATSFTHSTMPRGTIGQADGYSVRTARFGTHVTWRCQRFQLQMSKIGTYIITISAFRVRDHRLTISSYTLAHGWTSFGIASESFFWRHGVVFPWRCQLCWRFFGENPAIHCVGCVA